MTGKVEKSRVKYYFFCILIELRNSVWSESQNLEARRNEVGDSLKANRSANPFSARLGGKYLLVVRQACDQVAMNFSMCETVSRRAR